MARTELPSQELTHPAGVGLETGDEVTWAVVGTVGCGLTAAVWWDWLQATSKIPTRQSTRALMSRSQSPSQGS